MSGWLSKLQWRDLALPCFAALAVVALLFKVPPMLMDFLLSFNLALSAILFLTTFFVEKPLDFSSFPTLLLTTTLFRLVLNVSTTRLILTEGNAGDVIDAFSRFVAGDNVVVGAVVFLIFIIIQFVVITKGATRISEVSARFALDALPGKQAAIDFDLNAGNITEEEAKAARAELMEQADFYGSMDGASKFVRGDAIAGLAIVMINLIGGFAIGMAQRGLTFSEALDLYSKLTIGDGLVSQVPAFLISLATGLLVSRASRPQNVSRVALTQTFGRPIALLSTAALLFFLAFTGLPRLPLLTLASGCLALAWSVSRKKTRNEKEKAKETNDKSAAKKKSADEDDIEEYIAVDPAALEIGPGLVSIAAPEGEPTLLDRVKRVRQQLASELGVILPKTRVRDSNALDDLQFSIKLSGEEVAQGIVYPQMVLAVESDLVFDTIKGLQTTAPAVDKPAVWIDRAQSDQARDAGYEIWTPGDVVEKKLLEVVRREAASLLTRDATKRLVERWKDSAPALVAELTAESEADAKGKTNRLARLQQVLQLLLRERVSIRRLDVALEALSDLNLREPDADAYRSLEYARIRLARSISAQYRNGSGVLRVAMLDPSAEDALRQALTKTDDNEPALALGIKALKTLNAAVRDALNALREADFPPVLLVDKTIRYALRQTLTADSNADAIVLALDEIDRSTKVSQEVLVQWDPNAK